MIDYHNLKRRDHSTKVYIIQLEETPFLKIGIFKHPDKRMSDLEAGTPFQLRLIAEINIPGNLARKVELHLHAALSKYHVKREWFRIELVDLLPLFEAALKDFRLLHFGGGKIQAKCYGDVS